MMAYVGALHRLAVSNTQASSVLSQSISLPRTDASSSSPSPPSDMSRSAMLHPSPPRPPAIAKSKKELWRDLKIQSKRDLYL